MNLSTINDDSILIYNFIAIFLIHFHSLSFSFELSVPGNALLATPDYGNVASLSSLAVSVGVNESAFDRESNKRNGLALPWTGSLYVNGDDGATVAVKVSWWFLPGSTM